MKTDNLPATKAPVTILLVEDDPAHAEMVRRTMSEVPIEHLLIHASDGQSALDFLTSSPPPDLILLDLRLPKVDGIELLLKIRELASLKSTPVIVLTTSASHTDLDAVIGLGAKSYIIKPGSVAAFTEILGADYMSASPASQPQP